MRRDNTGSARVVNEKSYTPPPLKIPMLGKSNLFTYQNALVSISFHTRNTTPFNLVAYSC